MNKYYKKHDYMVRKFVSSSTNTSTTAPGRSSEGNSSGGGSKNSEGSDMVIPHIADAANEKAANEKAADENQQFKSRTRSSGKTNTKTNVKPAIVHKPVTRSSMSLIESIKDSENMCNAMTAKRAQIEQDTNLAFVNSVKDQASIDYKHANLDSQVALLLKSNGLVMLPQERNGSCVFNSLGVVLKMSPENCRTAAVEFVSENFDVFCPVNKDNKEDGTVLAYRDRMSRTRDQGDIIEIVALASVYKLKVVLWTASYQTPGVITSQTYFPLNFDVLNAASLTTVHLVRLKDPNEALMHYHLAVESTATSTATSDDDDLESDDEDLEGGDKAPSSK